MRSSTIMQRIGKFSVLEGIARYSTLPQILIEFCEVFLELLQFSYGIFS